jgi:hypothetical protein
MMFSLTWDYVTGQRATEQDTPYHRCDNDKDKTCPTKQLNLFLRGLPHCVSPF